MTQHANHGILDSTVSSNYIRTWQSYRIDHIPSWPCREEREKKSHTFSIHSSKYTEECWFRDGVKRFTTVLEEEMGIHHNNSARLPFYRFINPFIRVYAEECEKFEISTNLLVNALSRSRWRFRIQWIVVMWWWCKNEWEGNKKSTHIHHSTEMFW